MIQTKNDLSEYCLRKLGKPVIQINVDATQVDDRIEEALQVYRERHYDATQETWVIYELTQTDVDNGYITLSDDIAVVEELLPESVLQYSSDFMTYGYQVTVNQFTAFKQFDAINYHMTMQNLATLAEALPQQNRVIHTKHMNRLAFRSPSVLVAGEKMFMKVWKDIDPETHQKVYNDKWLKAYTTALIKLQWGNNMKKHSGIQLLGGVTVNGQDIYNEAVEEIQQLEEQLELDYQLPNDIFMA